MHDIVLIAHNLRSCHNVGSLLRTAEGLGITKVYLTGYTPYPAGGSHEQRLPHEAAKLDKQIHKTALDAEHQVSWENTADIFPLLTRLRADGYALYAVEQADSSVLLPNFQPPHKIALVVGREVDGVETDVLAACDGSLEIPMFGRKESFNVVQAAAMAMYHCQFAVPSQDR